MNTLIRIILTSILSIVLLSCDFALNIKEGTRGNGNVIRIDRPISSDFNHIKVSQGLELYITQSDAVTLSVEADENLHDLIKTEIENNTLKIYTAENIKSAASKKIIVNTKAISSIKATSGSSVYGTNTVKEDEIELSTTSGANMSLDITTQQVTCQATSGSSVNLSGTTNLLNAEATSGSRIKATDLISNIARVKASSGANVSTNTSKELTASASSGGAVSYSGKPEKVNTSNGTSGSVREE